MAEVEIHTGHHPIEDRFGQRVGVAVGMIGIVLAIVTIDSHRAHTTAVIHRTEANDEWVYFQAKKIREHLLDVGVGLADVLAVDSARTQAIRKHWMQDRDHYAKETAVIEREAHALEAESAQDEARALRLDLGEGFLELGLVLSSLYFLSKRRLFPAIGAVAAVTGIVFGVASLLV